MYSSVYTRIEILLIQIRTDTARRRLQRGIYLLLRNLAHNLRFGLVQRERSAPAQLVDIESRRLNLNFGDFALLQGLDVLLYVG